MYAHELAIDDQLLQQALTVGGYRTKRETVNGALREFIQRRKRLELLKLVGRSSTVSGMTTSRSADLGDRL